MALTRKIYLGTDVTSALLQYSREGQWEKIRRNAPIIKENPKSVMEFGATVEGVQLSTKYPARGERTCL
jgi:hypothetical protein